MNNKISKAEFDCAVHVVNNVRKSMTHPDVATEYMDDVELQSYIRAIDIINQYKAQVIQKVK